MKAILPYVLLSILIFGCTTSEQEQPADEEIVPDSLENTVNRNRKDSIEIEEKSKARSVVRFICRDIGQGLDNPLYEVSLLVGRSYYTLDTIHTCEPIRYGDFEEFGIPGAALSAAGGWWKNAGDYFYALEDRGEIVVLHAWQTEEQSTQGFFYKEKRRILIPQPEPLEDM